MVVVGVGGGGGGGGKGFSRRKGDSEFKVGGR